MENSKGLVTIPTDLDVVPETLELMKRWGADAIRDCDGTDFPEALKDADAEIYSTYYTTRKTMSGEGKSGRDTADVSYDAVLYG